jgi:hypothetical protein
MKMPKWSAHEEGVLSANAHRGSKWLMKELGRSWAAIHTRAHLLGVIIPKAFPYDVTMGELEIKKWVWENRIRPRLTVVGECWEWNGANKLGYGGVSFFVGQRKFTCATHRIALETSLSRLIAPDFALHSCDNPKCNNPKHLFPGTPRDNTLDMHAKGRAGGCFKKGHKATIGEACGSSKFKEEDVVAIRIIFARELLTISEIARQFGAAFGTIKSIVDRRTWKHVPEVDDLAA